jgi:hypothetical protein
MTKKEVLTVLDKLFKISSEKVAEALTLSDEMADTDQVDEKKFLDVLLAEQSKRVKLKFDDGYKAAEKKIKSDLEKELKDEYNIETDLQGLDLVKHIIEAQAPESKGGKSKLTDEEVKKHPIYLKLEADKKKEAETLNKDWDTKLKAEQESRNYEKLLVDMDDEAIKLFKEIGEPILPEDKAIADKHVKRLLLDELKTGRKFQKTEAGYLILDADGKRVEDQAGNPVTLKDLVTNTARSNFQFKAAQDRNSPANKNGQQQQQQQQQGQKKYAGKPPANASDYMNTLLDETLEPEVKADYKTQYGKQFSN